MPRDETILKYFFRTAATYNLLWGLWIIFFSNVIFNLVQLPLPNHIWIWQTVGMIVGIYSIGYWHVSNHLKEGKILVLIGLLGKIFGVCGWLYYFLNGNLNRESLFITFFNDIIWLPGFIYYFWFTGKRKFPFVVWTIIFLLITHIYACILSAFITKMSFWNQNVSERISFFMLHEKLWALAWFGWIFCSLSFLLFSFSIFRNSERKFSIPAIVITLFATVPDVSMNFSLSSLYTVLRFDFFDKWTPVISFGIANTFYTIATAMIIIFLGKKFSWITRLTGWASVIFGFGLSFCAIPIILPFTAFFSGGLMVFFNLWAFLLLINFRRLPNVE